MDNLSATTPAPGLSAPGLLTSHQRMSVPATILLGVVATITLGIIPVFVAGMVAEFGLGDREVGILAAADMCGSTIAAMVGLWLQSRLSWQKILYGAIVIVVCGNLAAMLQESFWPLIACRVFAGFGNGFIIALVFIGLCHSHHPDRSFGFYTLGQIATQTLLITTLPYLIAWQGMAGVYLFLALVSFLSAFLIRFFPTGLTQVEQIKESVVPVRLSVRALLALAALSLYFIAVAAIWGYLEPIGSGFSLSLVEVGQALGTASLIAIAGPLTVVILATKFGRVRSLSFAFILHLMSIVILVYGDGFFQYLLAASLFAFALNYSFPYQMGILSTFDKDGSIAIIALILQLASFTFGPVLASFMLFGGYSLILWSCQILFALALIAYWLSVRKLEE